MTVSEERESPSVAILIAHLDGTSTAEETETSLDELARLLDGLGVRVEDRVVQRGRGGAVLGAGKLEELKARIAGLTPAPIVVVDGALAPGAHRDLERALDAPVLDRIGVVLRVFQRRARTRLAQVEIELAQLAYDAPRVREGAAGDDRVGGGGRGGRGHTNVELQKQAMRDRRVELERELERLRETRRTQLVRRRTMPRVALVGYTNAGKSSLLRALTGEEVHVEDALFATLDPTVRALSSGPRILVSDTVGFVRNLPHALVSSFRSTLDEARDADLLLVVADAADRDWREQLAVTRDTLAAIGIDAPAQVVLNKADRLDPAARAEIQREWPDALVMSALAEPDVRALRELVIAFFRRDDEHDVLVVPFTEGKLLAEIRGQAEIRDERYDADGAVLSVRASSEALARWRSALAPRPPIDSVETLMAAARRYGLALHAEGAKLDESGLDFRVAHARDPEGTAWIVRTPRRREVADSAQHEARVLHLVRPSLDVAVPDWALHARDVIAYPRMAGRPGWTIDAGGTVVWAFDPTAPPEPFLDSYARLLVALHSISSHRASFAGLRVETVDAARRELGRAMERTRDALSPPEPIWARWRAWLANDSLWPPQAALVHGDLHPGHLLLDGAGSITGVLDWTEARVTDPSVDLAMFVGCFGRAALEQVVARMERAGAALPPRVVDHALERWAAYPAVVAAWALDTGSEPALAHARHLLAVESRHPPDEG